MGGEYLSPASVARDLAAQAADPSSALRAGGLTRHTKHLAVELPARSQDAGAGAGAAAHGGVSSGTGSRRPDALPSLEAAHVAWSALRGEGGAEMDDAARMCASCRRALLAGAVCSSYVLSALCESISSIGWRTLLPRIGSSGGLPPIGHLDTGLVLSLTVVLDVGVVRGLTAACCRGQILLFLRAAGIGRKGSAKGRLGLEGNGWLAALLVQLVLIVAHQGGVGPPAVS